MNLQNLLYRFRWLHAPAGILMLLLQRTPVLRVLVSESPGFGLQSGEVLKSAFALAALGAYNSVAGATVFNATATSPTTVTPASGPANITTFTSTIAKNAAFSLAINGTGAPSTIRSWKVTGTLPAGITVTGGTAVTGGFVFNGLKVTLAGTPTASGNQTLSVRAYDTLDAKGNNAGVTCIVSVTGGAAPTPQTITFGALAGKTFGAAPFTVSATASSGLTPTFSIFSGPATIAGSTVTLTGAGTVVVRASQAGNATYAAATPVDQSFSVAQATQTITFGALTGKTFGDAPFTVSATASSGLAPTYSIFSGPATISGNTVTLTGVGTVVVRASQSGNTNFAAATPVDQSFNVGLTAQTITFGALTGKTFGAAPFTVSATASSGLTPTFTIFSGPATITGNTVTLTGVGTVVIRASQSGNASYAAATPVDQSFSVAQAAQTITFGALSSKATGDAPFTVSATASSGLTPTFSIFSGPATISGNTVTLTGVGTVVVRASQSGNANFAAATPVDQSFTVGLTAQTITFGALTGKTFGDAAFTVSATATSGLTPTFSIFSGPATITGNTVTITGAGTVVVRASQAGNATFAAATPIDQSFAVAQAAQTITFGALTGKTFGDAAFTVSATASSGLTPTFTIFSGPATISGNTVTLTGVGTVVVRASQSGNANYAAATPFDQSFSVAQATQTITFGALTGKTFGAAPFTVSATASSGLTPTFTIFSGPATITGNTVTLTGAGTVVVRASQSGSANFAAATPVDQSFAVAQAAQTITFGSLANKATGDAPFAVSATASSGLAPTFTIFSGPATISGNTVTLTGVGTVVVRASQSGNTNYAAAASVDQSFSVGLTAQTITFGALTGKTFGDAAFTVSATASSGLTPTFSIFSGPATITGNTVTITGVGTVVVRASQAGNASFAAATPVDQSFSVAQAAQTITFGALSGKTFSDAAYTVSATASSGLTPTFTIFSGPATISGNTVTLTGVGTVVIRASQSGNASYAAATPVDQSFSVAQAAQTISFGTLTGKTFGAAPFTVSATASSGLTPTFTIFSGPATISGNTVTLNGVGTVVIRASQSGNASFAAATPVDQSFSVAQAAQTISFGALAGKTFGAAAFTVSATASSGLTPTFSIFSGPATISGNVVTITGAGTAIVRASQTGNGNYAAAAPVDQSFSVAQAAQTITFGALSSKAAGDAPFTVSATASSGLTPTFSIFSGPATISGNTVTLTGVGTVVVRASQSGNTNYAAATPVDQSFSVGLTAQTITFGALSGKTFGDAAFTVSATASSGLTPTFSIFSGPATISGNTVTLTGVGTVVVRASQSGNANYAAATSMDQSFSVVQAAQTISFGALTGKTFGDAAFTVSASASSGLAPTFSIFSGPATISGNTVTLTGVGTVVVRASQSGNANYAAAISVYQSFSVAQAAQTITFGALAGKSFGDAAFTVSATASSGLAPTFFIVSGPATISGNTVTLTGVGTVVVRASQSGNANYAAATPLDQSFSVAQTAQTITFGALTGKTFGDAAFTVSASASSGLAPTFTIFSGPATISGNIVTLTGVGTVVVRASQSGNANYAAATPLDQSFSVAQAAQTITFGALADKASGVAPFTVSATATSGLAPTFFIVSGPATISGNTVTLTGVGTVVVRASQSGNANYAAAASVDQSFSVGKAIATVTLGSLAQSFTGSALSATATTVPSGLAVTFTYNATSTAPTNAGSYTVVGTINDTLYQGSASGTLIISPASQSLTFGALSNKTFGDDPFTVSATASSGLAPTYSIAFGPATISGDTVTLTGGGTVGVRFSQAGNANYAAASTLIQTFSVNSTPVFTTHPLSQSAVVGGNVTFTASVTGLPTPTLQWYQDTTALTGQTGTTLTLSNVQTSSAGNYTVKAANSVAPDGVSSNAASLTVNPAPAAPVFTTQPTSQTVAAGATVTFTVVAEGTPTPTIQWFSGVSASTGILNGTLFLTGQTGNTLTLTNVQASASGSHYFAVATNSAAPAGVTSNSAILNVNFAPIFTTQPATQSVFVGGNVTFTAATAGFPSPTYQWYQGTTLLTGQTGPSLTLTNVQDTAAGSYTVKATNSSAPDGVISNAATLTVNLAPTTPSAPVITQQPNASTVAYIGDTVTLSVVATGNPDPAYQWKRGGGILSGQTKSTLVFKSAQLDDTASYSVTVTNSAAPKGVTSRTVKLSVLVPPPAAVVVPAALCIGERLTLDLSGGATYPAGVTFKTSRLPTGLRLDPLTGRIDGILTGRPGNYAVTYWTTLGRTQSTKRTLRFAVASFPSVLTGGFETLLDPATTDLATSVFPAGKVELNVASNGTFTGRLWTDDVPSYPISGTLLLAGDHDTAATTISVARSPFGQTPDYQLTLSVNSTGLITAALTSNAVWLGSGAGSKLAGRASPANYTMVLRNPVNLAASSSELPAGDGFFTVSCSATGVFTLKGCTGDGTALTATTSLGSDGMLRLYAKPYSTAGGYLAGTLALTPRADLPSLRHITVAGGSDLYWRKPASSGDSRFAAGFGPLALEATMEPWLGSSKSAVAPRLGLPSDGSFVVDVSGPALTGDDAAFVASLPVTLNLNSRNAFSVVGPNPTEWKLQLDAGTGRFYGTCRFREDEDTRSFTIEGVLLQAAPGDTLIGGGSLLPVSSSDDEKDSSLLNAVEFTRP